MSALAARANFVCPLLIVVIQHLYNDHFRTQIRKELHVALEGWRIHSRHMSNYARFTAMSGDGQKLSFPPFPDDQLDWGPWLRQQIQTTNACTLRIKNDQGKYETISYLSLYIMGYRWDVNVNMWPANADIAKLKAAAVIKNTLSITDEEKGFLADDEKLFHFTDARTHRQMQVTLRAALMQALQDHALFPEIEIFDKTMGPLDLYQGSRLLAKISELCHFHLRRAKGKLIPEALQIPSDIQANNDISKAEMHEQISRLDKFVLALTLGGDKNAESEFVEHFFEILHDHPRPIIVSIIKEAETTGPTIAALRAVLKFMPLDPTRTDASAHLTSAPPEPSLMERTCTAMMTFLSTTGPKSSDPAGSARGKTFSTEQQNAYIERLKAQSKAKDQTIKTLQQALTSRDASAGNGRGGRGGRGAYAGRGRGRGRGRVTSEGLPEAELAEGGEIFMAQMDVLVESDLAFEQDSQQAEIDQAKIAAKLEACANAMEDESSDDEPPAPKDPPVKDKPVYSNPEGPPPPQAAKANWFFVFLGCFIGCLGFCLALSQMDFSNFPLLSKTFSATETFYSQLVGVGTVYCFSRRFWNISPIYLGLAVAVVFMGFCNANAAVIDIQVPDGPPISFTSFDSFRPSPLVSPSMHDFLVQESSAFMVSQNHWAAAGDPSKFSCKWCTDCGANRNISNDITDFTSNYRAVNINLTVAKQNISMQAVGIGDCLVHCTDNMGRPCKLEIKNVLHVPTASRNLMSSSSLAEQGYQTVLPSVHAVFPPGLYLPRRARSPLKPGSGQQPRYIPIETINGLYFISTRNDTGPDPPKTRANEVIVFSRKLGHCPLQTLWDTRKVVTGLEFLADSHFPRNYVSGDVHVGKSTKADQPSSTMTVPSRPNEVWHMDTVGPTKTTSVHGYRYNTTFTCGYSIPAMFSRMVMLLRLKFQNFKSVGMPILRVFESFMENRVFSVVIMLLSTFRVVRLLSGWLRVFALKQFVPQKVIRQVLLSA